MSPPPCPTLFPYTTLFRSPQGIIAVTLVTAAFPAISHSAVDGDHRAALRRYGETNRLLAVPMVLCTVMFIALSGPIRSEEHTSELQSRGHLVCRLLLEKQ